MEPTEIECTIARKTAALYRVAVTRRGNLNGVIPWLRLRAALRNVILRADRLKLRRERGSVMSGPREGHGRWMAGRWQKPNIRNAVMALFLARYAKVRDSSS